MTATTQEYVDAACMIGSGNVTWVPCALDGGSPNDAFNVIEGIKNVGSTSYYLQFMLPLPTSRGGKALHLTRVKILLNAADTNNYLQMIKVIGVTTSGLTQIYYNNNNPEKTAGDIDKAVTDTDCSGYDQVIVTLYCVAQTANYVIIRGALLKCYYT